MQQATNDHIDKVTSSIMQACTDYSTMTTDSLDAALKSTTVIVKGCQDVCNSVNTLLQNTLSHSMKASQAVMSAKTTRDLVDAQSNLIKTSFDFVLSELSKISQISARTAQQAVEPVSNHVNSTINKISKSKAA